MTTLRQGGLRLSTALAALVFSLTLVALAPPASAQTGVYFGNRFGLLRSDLSGDGVASSEVRDVPLPFNVMLGVQVNRFVGLQTELIMTERGGESVVGADGLDLGESQFSVGYVEVPLLLRVQAPIQNGPYVAAFGGAALAFRTGRSDFSERFSSTVPSAIVGGEVGLTYRGARGFVDARYNVGLGGLLDDDAFGGSAPDVKASGLAITVGGAFGLKELFSQTP